MKVLHREKRGKECRQSNFVLNAGRLFSPVGSPLGTEVSVGLISCKIACGTIVALLDPVGTSRGENDAVFHRLTSG